MVSERGGKPGEERERGQVMRAEPQHRTQRVIQVSQNDSEGYTGLHRMEAVKVQEIGYVSTGMGLCNTAIGS
jgi:hypothetical protein